MWAVHKPYDFEVVNLVKRKTYDPQNQSEGEKGSGKHFAGAMVTILTKIRDK